MQGKFIGVGIGPGDPELLTLKAVRIIQDSKILAVPISDVSLLEPKVVTVNEAKEYLNSCVAYTITSQALPEVEQKKILLLPMPMIKDKERLAAIHDLGTKEVEKIINAGENIVFLTLGDPTVYSTCMYIHKRLKRLGYRTELIPGVPSFCAVAAKLDCSLVENSDELHILPASYQIEEGLSLSGTKVLMKTGKKISVVRELLLQEGLDVQMVENCGMDGEKVYQSVEEIPDKPSYYSILVAKSQKGEV